MGYVATRATFGPPQILSPVVKCWGHPGRLGLCSYPAHLWATYDFVPLSTIGHPEAAGVM